MELSMAPPASARSHSAAHGLRDAPHRSKAKDQSESEYDVGEIEARRGAGRRRQGDEIEHSVWWNEGISEVRRPRAYQQTERDRRARVHRSERTADPQHEHDNDRR